MLFGNRKKIHEELLQYLAEAFLNNSKSLEEMGERLTRQLEEKQEESNKLLRRQSGSLEDILEELQRQGEEGENVTGQLQELRNREKALVELCCLLSGQKEMILQQILAEGILPENIRDGWQNQAKLMEREAEKLERQCTFQRIGTCGEMVDYDCHEILSVCETRREEQNGLIAEVFSTGYCYQGRILKKAQVAVYKYDVVRNEQ